uniref:Uncharacterized protein n=1 Tax=Anguilla anguilla TaxID=7936 RepID=A0A0E9P6G0_ANGAN
MNMTAMSNLLTVARFLRTSSHERRASYLM